MNRQISAGITYPVSFFTCDRMVTELDTPLFEEQITSLEGVTQCSLYVEALTWFAFDQDEISSMSFKEK